MAQGWLCNGRQDGITFVAAILNVSVISSLHAAGAIAINYAPPNRSFGFSVGQASDEAAKQQALNQCGAGCGAEVFSQSCGALVFGTAQGSPTQAKIVGKGFGDTNDQAVQRALAACEMNSSVQCGVIALGCN